MLSAVIGVVAVLVALSPLLGGASGSGHGYVFTTVGLTAICFGIGAMRRNRFTRSVGITASATVGIGLGAIGLLAMLAVTATAHTTTGGNALLSSSLNGIEMGTSAASTEVTLTSTVVVGSGAPTVVVGNGGSVRLAAGYSVRSTTRNPTIDLRLERRIGGDAWSSTGVTASAAADDGSLLTVVTPPYSTSAAVETVEYRLATSTSASKPVSVVYENQHAYTGMAATIYGYAALLPDDRRACRKPRRA